MKCNYTSFIKQSDIISEHNLKIVLYDIQCNVDQGQLSLLSKCCKGNVNALSKRNFIFINIKKH